jgi:hypothetical protein
MGEPNEKAMGGTGTLNVSRATTGKPRETALQHHYDSMIKFVEYVKDRNPVVMDDRDAGRLEACQEILKELKERRENL